MRAGKRGIKRSKAVRERSNMEKLQHNKRPRPHNQKLQRISKQNNKAEANRKKNSPLPVLNQQNSKWDYKENENLDNSMGKKNSNEIKNRIPERSKKQGNRPVKEQANKKQKQAKQKNIQPLHQTLTVKNNI
jgi:hypothetical protein